MKIFCAGRNYAEHASELHNAIPDEPVIFMKPPTALLRGHFFFLPAFSKDMHYECELVFRISRTAKTIQRRFAYRYVDAVTTGIDFTARDLQQHQKKNGLPWEIAKSFDNSAVAGKFVATSNLKNASDIQFHLEKNGVIVQEGHSSDMLFPVDALIAYISKFFSFQQGDLLFTGTPAGVGPVHPGDVLKGFLENEKVFEIQVK